MSEEPQPRIAPLQGDELSGDALELAARVRATFGLQTEELPEAIATMLRHPGLYRAHVDFVVGRAKAFVLCPRDLELVILRTAWLCQSAYVWGQHVDFGKKGGLTDEEIAWIIEGSTAPGWSARDAAMCRMCEELHDTSFVSDETWDVIAQHFSEAQIIEMLAIIGNYHEVAFTYNALRVRLLPGSKGLAAR